MHEVVIADTSPLFYLHRLGLINILNKLYGNIIVPRAVINELEQGGLQGEDVPNIRNYSWIQFHQAKIPKFLKLITGLDSGETEVLALALEKPGSLIIIDERLARRVAELQGLKVTGTLGVLLKAKQKGYIVSVSPILERLLQLGFRVNDKLKKDILKLAGELLK